MSDEIRINRSANSAAVSGDNDFSPRHSGGSKLPWIILAVIIVVLVVLGFVFKDNLMGGDKKAGDKVSGYQAVFLTNGQVYFGKLSGAHKDYVTLNDIYYLQVVNQNPIQGTQESSADTQTPGQQPQLSLVKLGNELHGPLDEMKINREQILFFEDMKSDSKVMQAVKEYQANPAAANGGANQQGIPPTQQPVTTPTR